MPKIIEGAPWQNIMVHKHATSNSKAYGAGIRLCHLKKGVVP